MDSEFQLQAKLDQLDAIEKEMETLRPRKRARKIFILLILTAVFIGVGAAVSMGSSVWRSVSPDVLAVSLLATAAAIILPHRKLKALANQRTRLLDQIGAQSPRDGSSPC